MIQECGMEGPRGMVQEVVKQIAAPVMMQAPMVEYAPQYMQQAPMIETIQPQFVQAPMTMAAPQYMQAPVMETYGGYGGFVQETFTAPSMAYGAPTMQMETFAAPTIGTNYGQIVAPTTY